MKLYQFSPILDKDSLDAAIMHLHLEAHKLSKQTFERYLDNSGNIGIFCHYQGEYEYLKQLRDRLVKRSDNPDQKYFELVEPIVITATKDIPEATYTHLYIRKPDPYRAQVGDIDFRLEPAEYIELKQSMLAGKQMVGARTLDRVDLDMIELFDPDIDVLAYVTTRKMTEDVRLKISGGPTDLS
ncbi:MAG TPA: hypothetical protein VIH90_00490 [Candidatus Saccharimonadales bacterium]